jgi:methionine-rich copper-binding protein CopC
MSRPSLAVVRRRTSSSRPLRRHRLLALGAAGLVVVAPVALAAPASAHDSLTGSNPSAGSTVTIAPERVKLTFTDEVKKIGLTVLVKDPSGASVTDGEPTIDGTAVLQPVNALTVPGEYTVAYRVVSSDGHPINGRFTFTLDVPSPSPSSTPSETATPAASSASSASLTPSSASPSASESAVAASPAASTSDAGGGSAWLLVGAGLIVALVVTGVVLARRRSA